MDWDGAMGRQMEALTRMLAMLAAMSGLIDAARLRLPPDVHQALLAPLRLAEEAARAVPVSESGLPLAFGPAAAARLRRCMVLLCRTIAMLRRYALRDPGPCAFGMADLGAGPLSYRGSSDRHAPAPDTS